MATTTEPARTGFAQRTVDGLARRIERPFTRRSFLVRSALVGSVLTIAPLRWLLRPTTAYASICGEGASCSSGWTAFCCTINDGANTCPPGSYAAGWWKIDRSPFCQGSPRYIVDCNRSPGASCNCRCADGACDQRRTCCNNFRYGQCNTQVGGVTEVVCRVVLCTAPWTWDPACGTSLRTDNRTVTHNASCLPGEDATAIDLHYQDLGLVGSALGAPSSGERSGPRGGAWRVYEHGVIAWHGAAGAHVLLGAVADRYASMQGPAGALGYPIRDQRGVGDDRGEVVVFERGAIYLDGDEAIAVHGPAARYYEQLGGPTGELGYPTDGTEPVGDGRGSVTRFADGAIYASGGGAVEVIGAMLERYTQLGGPTGSGIGYPAAPADGDVQRFAGGVLVRSGAGDVHVLRGAIAQRYLQLGAVSGPWGAPSGDQRDVAGGARADFGAVTAFSGPAGGAYVLDGALLERYLDEGGPQGRLGFPTSDGFRTRRGVRRAEFEGGAIEIDGGGTHVLEPGPTRSVDELRG